MANYCIEGAADLILQYDFDENLLNYKSWSDNFSLADSVDGNSSDESNKPDVPTISLTVHRPHGGRMT